MINIKLYKVTFLIVGLGVLLLGSCKLGRFIYYNFADITDYKIFPSRTVSAPETPFLFEQGSSSKVPSTLTVTTKKGKEKITFDQYLEQNKTVAFVVIRNDSIHYENYFSKYDKSSIVPSFSVAKSITSILVGCAIDDGLISSIEDPITNYLPEFAEKGFDKIKIKHLLNMTSGIDFNESYSNPFGQAASIYYGRNLERELGKFKLKYEPGKRFYYSSGDTQLLGAILKSVLGKKSMSISDYLEKKLWVPLGMEYDATWSLDKKEGGIEKTFCCINARARDFAKIGRLYLNEGNWNGEQIIPKEWVASSTQYDTTAGNVWYYQHQWWIQSNNGTVFYAEGILGQFIYINKHKNMVIVRLGKNVGKTANWISLFNLIADQYDKKKNE